MTQTTPSSLLLRMELAYLEPAIYRIVQVPATVTLADVHHCIQVAMGWEDAHLHSFQIGKQVYDPDGEWGEREDRVTLLEALGGKKTLSYTYDFGDSWDHKITLVRSLPDRIETVRCLEGANACPPEDCGGVPGYAQLLEVLQKPGTREYRDMLDWLADPIDPTSFDLDATNERLSYLKLK